MEVYDVQKRWIYRVIAVAVCAAMAAAAPSSTASVRGGCNHPRLELVVEYEPEERRIKEAEVCQDCGLELADYYAADAGFTGGEYAYDGEPHGFGFFDNSDTEVTVSVRLGLHEGDWTLTSTPEFIDPGEYVLYYEIDYSFFYSVFTESGAARLTILPPQQTGPGSETEPETEPEPGSEPEPEPEPEPKPEPVPVTNRTIFYGNGSGNFRPNDALTRAELAAVAARVLGGKPCGTSGMTRFSDVPESAWYAPYVARLAEAGVMLGVGGGLFEPGRAVTTVELALVVGRLGTLMDLYPAPLPDSVGVTRAEAAEVFAALLGRDRCPGPQLPAPFADISPDDVFYAAVAALSAEACQ